MTLSEKDIQMLKEAQERATEKVEKKKTLMPTSSNLDDIEKLLIERHGGRWTTKKPTDRTCQCGVLIEPTSQQMAGNMIYWHLVEELCKECHDEKEKKERREEYIREKERREAWRKEHIKELLTKAGVPTRYLDCTLDNFKEEPGNRAALLGARDYLEEKTLGLFLFGPPGTGKTHLAVGVLRETLLRGKHVAFWPATRLVMKLREYSMDDEPETLSEFINILCGIGVSSFSREEKGVEHLVIDDLGSEKVTDFVKQSLYTIVNERDGEMLPLIITSNLGLKELAERLDPRLASRLAGSCRIIKLSGQDWRLKKK